MKRNYTVQTRILRPVAAVFDAVVSSEQLCHYFTTETTGDLATGDTVGWRWDHYEFTLPVRVDEVVENERIELTLDSAEWKKTATESYPVKVIFEFEPLDDGHTMLSISEAGWRTDDEGLKGSHDNCGGWTHMAMCLKAWLEHGIDLR
jgi:uncharacterized protein YndB with AHSA1/START domain